MNPKDFRYRVADDGRIVVVGLTLQETLEFETLFRWKDDTVTDTPRELRLLELYLKHHAALSSRCPIADAGTELFDLRHSREVSSSGHRRVRQPARMSQRIHVRRSAVVIGMAGVGMFIILIAASL
jgi:hypothetical protein